LQPGGAAGAGRAAQRLLHPLPLLRLSLLLLVLVRTQGWWQAFSLVGALRLLQVARAEKDSQQRLLLLQLLEGAPMTATTKTVISICSSRGAKLGECWASMHAPTAAPAVIQPAAAVGTFHPRPHHVTPAL
jgi:hypothetical protein